MIEVNIQFEFDGYDIIAEAEVWSQADIRNLRLDFIGLSKEEIKKLDKEILKESKELAKIEIFNEHFETELKF